MVKDPADYRWCSYGHKERLTEGSGEKPMADRSQGILLDFSVIIAHFDRIDGLAVMQW